MNLKRGYLSIHYAGKGKRKLEKDLEILLASHSYYRWASGFDLEDKVRDLAFRKRPSGGKDKEKEKEN